MAKQKAKNSRKAAPGVGADDAMAEAAAPIKGVKRKGGSIASKGVAHGRRAGKGKAAAVRKGKAPALPLAVADAPQLHAAPLRALHKIVRRTGRSGRLERLEIAIEEVRLGGRSSPRTRKLQLSGIPKMAQKLIEEAGEAAIEAMQGNRIALINEGVDLLYNLLVLLSASGVTLERLWAEMDRRELTLGMAEKLPKIIDPDG